VAVLALGDSLSSECVVAGRRSGNFLTAQVDLNVLILKNHGRARRDLRCSWVCAKIQRCESVISLGKRFILVTNFIEAFQHDAESPPYPQRHDHPHQPKNGHHDEFRPQVDDNRVIHSCKRRAAPSSMPLVR
jgi:hypothetical protein